MSEIPVSEKKGTGTAKPLNITIHIRGLLSEDKHNRNRRTIKSEKIELKKIRFF